ncbi:mitochondrial amidoxime reducing component 2-like [Eupeodes corollae]|uniref:mitochondrial amidoxime reducing component 2-like n=1 Tax=Eupeodes corollae TaxID=290404 RepID=UPI00249363C0|nr:mitochondrial amidoxime reducing component 2-like [Eupeodes corollae]
MKGVQLVLVLGGATFVGGFLYFFHKRRSRRRSLRELSKPPKDNWQYVGTLEEIIMYPIKSCGGIELQEVLCEKSGIKFGHLKDRQFILVNEDDKPMFAGAQPEMLKIKPKLINDDEIEVTAPGMDPLILNVHQLSEGRKEVIKAFGKSSTRLVECDSYFGNWFSKFLFKKETAVKLFMMSNNLKNILFRKNWKPNPYMVLVNESIMDLKDRLPNTIHHWQFRGNFVINNSQLPAFSEDSWKWMRIGNEAIFQYKAPCYRCILVNVDPFTAERSPDFEPLRTLKKYRMKPGQIEPEMGIYFNLYKEGSVKLGDEVFVVI